ncbi:MAG: energy transducer TonB [Acidobacteria bacterium]|nr:energy transducer TonB [Acidobacteriota bacterium]
MKLPVILALLLSLPSFADKVVKTSSPGQPPKAVKDYDWNEWQTPVLLYSGPDEDIYVASLQDKKKHPTTAILMQDYGAFSAKLYTFFKSADACLRERFTEGERTLPAAVATCKAQPIFLRKIEIKLNDRTITDIHTAGILPNGSIEPSTNTEVKGKVAFKDLPASLLAAIGALHKLAAPFYPALDRQVSAECRNSLEFSNDGDHGIKAPKPIYQPEPDYTPAAKKAKFEGDTRIRIMVDPTGAVQCARIIQPLPYGLDQEALKAVSAYRFEPAQQNGKAVAVDILVQVNFRVY